MLGVPCRGCQERQQHRGARSQRVLWFAMSAQLLGSPDGATLSTTGVKSPLSQQKMEPNPNAPEVTAERVPPAARPLSEERHQSSDKGKAAEEKNPPPPAAAQCHRKGSRKGHGSAQPSAPGAPGLAMRNGTPQGGTALTRLLEGSRGAGGGPGAAPAGRGQSCASAFLRLPERSSPPCGRGPGTGRPPALGVSGSACRNSLGAAPALPSQHNVGESTAEPLKNKGRAVFCRLQAHLRPSCPSVTTPPLPGAAAMGGSEHRLCAHMGRSPGTAPLHRDIAGEGIGWVPMGVQQHQAHPGDIPAVHMQRCLHAA